VFTVVVYQELCAQSLCALWLLLSVQLSIAASANFNMNDSIRIGPALPLRDLDECPEETDSLSQSYLAHMI